MQAQNSSSTIITSSNSIQCPTINGPMCGNIIITVLAVASIAFFALACVYSLKNCCLQAATLLVQNTTYYTINVSSIASTVTPILSTYIQSTTSNIPSTIVQQSSLFKHASCDFSQLLSTIGNICMFASVLIAATIIVCILIYLRFKNKKFVAEVALLLFVLNMFSTNLSLLSSIVYCCGSALLGALSLIGFSLTCAIAAITLFMYIKNYITRSTCRLTVIPMNLQAAACRALLTLTSIMAICMLYMIFNIECAVSTTCSYWCNFSLNILLTILAFAYIYTRATSVFIHQRRGLTKPLYAWCTKTAHAIQVLARSKQAAALLGIIAIIAILLAMLLCFQTLNSGSFYIIIMCLSFLYFQFWMILCRCREPRNIPQASIELSSLDSHTE